VARRDVIVTRYADDLVVGFESRTEGEQFAAQDRKRRGEGKPETFTFSGFTHHCGSAEMALSSSRVAKLLGALHALLLESVLSPYKPVEFSDYDLKEAYAQAGLPANLGLPARAAITFTDLKARNVNRLIGACVANPQELFPAREPRNESATPGEPYREYSTCCHRTPDTEKTPSESGLRSD
jgi:hypothetical protein